MMRAYDLSRSGTLDFTEFKNMLMAAAQDSMHNVTENVGS